ncbi:MAG: hypothetical protein ACXW5U_26865 [Thermoanaerobaculia bacterium]
MRTIAAAFLLASLQSATFCAWAPCYLLTNLPMWFDGPEPNTIQFFVESSAWEQLTYVSVAAYLALSICGGMFAGTFYHGRRAGRIGLAMVMVGVPGVATGDWVLPGGERDLITLIIRRHDSGDVLCGG